MSVRYKDLRVIEGRHLIESSWTIDANGDGLADELMIEIPAVGAAGGAPLPGFLEGIFGTAH
jgi:hypothetical protein